MQILTWQLILAYGLQSLLSFPVFAGDFEIVNRKVLTAEEINSGACSIRLVGEIAKGDAAKLESLFRQLPPRDHGNKTYSLCLNSEGGSFAAGARLALKIEDLLIATLVPKESNCLSACAIAFLGGVHPYWEETAVSRNMHSTAKIGFHMPFVAVSTGTYTPKHVNQFWQEANLAIGQLVTAFHNADSSVSEEQINTYMLLRILSSPPSKMYYLHSLQDIYMFNINVIDAKKPRLRSEKQLRSLCGNAIVLRGPSRGVISAYVSRHLQLPSSDRASDEDYTVSYILSTDNPKPRTVTLPDGNLETIVEAEAMDMDYACILRYSATDSEGADIYMTAKGQVVFEGAFIDEPLLNRTTHLGYFPAIYTLPLSTALGGLSQH